VGTSLIAPADSAFSDIDARVCKFHLLTYLLISAETTAKFNVDITALNGVLGINIWQRQLWCIPV